MDVGERIIVLQKSRTHIQVNVPFQPILNLKRRIQSPQVFTFRRLNFYGKHSAMSQVQWNLTDMVIRGAGKSELNTV